MRSSKTDKIKSLLGTEQENKPSNPALSIPDKEYIPPVYTKTGSGKQLINIAFLLINEQLGTVMERFNCCMCSSCVQKITLDVINQLPPMTVMVKHKSDEEKVNELAARYRQNMIQIITKTVIQVKSNPPHNQ